MTANELNLLIDILERRGEDRQLEAATMLRQQQERIKQLEETQEYLYKTHDADKAEIEALKALVISMSDRNANIQYTKASEK